MKTFLAIACFSLLSASSSLAGAGAGTYTSKCQMCHATDGSGSTAAVKALKAIPFSSPDIVKESDAELIASTTNGKGKMPAFSGKLAGTAGMAGLPLPRPVHIGIVPGK